METMERRVTQVEDMMKAVAARPEIEQYRDILLRLEKNESESRVMGHRLDETVESLKRTSNKLAARAARRERADAAPPPEPEQEEEGEPYMLPPPEVHHNGSGQAPRTRAFGKFT